MEQTVLQRPEILAPAGNADMLRAAVFAGADAVYLGLDGYNARRSAGNFDPDALREAVCFCHARGVANWAAWPMPCALLPPPGRMP